MAAVRNYRPEFVDARKFGVSASASASDNKTAIDAALAAADAVGGAVVVLPAGTIATTGGHTLPYKCSLVGQGAGTTTLSHTGNNTCVTVTYAGGTEHRMGVSDLKIAGNTGASAIGLDFKDVSFGAWATRVRITDYTAGVGFQLHNSAASQFTEGVVLDNCSSSNNAVGIKFKRTSGTDSFKGFTTRQFACNVPSGGVGMDFGVGLSSGASILVYDCNIHAYFWGVGSGATGTCWDVGQYAEINGVVNVFGEAGDNTSVKSIKNSVGGLVDVEGVWTFDNMLPDQDDTRTTLKRAIKCVLGSGGDIQVYGAPTNLASNPSFISDSNSGWNDFNTNCATARDTSVYRGEVVGDIASLKVTRSSGTTFSTFYGGVSISGATMGRVYQVAAWVYVPSGSQMIGKTIIPKLWEGGGASPDEITSGATQTIAAGWRRHQVTRSLLRDDRGAVFLGFTVPTGAASGDIFWIDDISVVQL